jgi:hypothetical protein
MGVKYSQGHEKHFAHRITVLVQHRMSECYRELGFYTRHTVKKRTVLSTKCTLYKETIEHKIQGWKMDIKRECTSIHRSKRPMLRKAFRERTPIYHYVALCVYQQMEAVEGRMLV